MDLVTLGEILIDMFPAEMGRGLTEVSAFHPKPGGAPANVAVAAQRLGAQTAFIGCVGADAFGQHLIDVMRTEGVATQGIQIDEQARTTMAFIAMRDENTPEFVFYRNPGADTRIAPERLDRALLNSTRALHFGSLSLTDEPAFSATLKAIQIAREGGALISYDVNYRPALWSSPEAALAAALDLLPEVDLLKVNEEELVLLSGQSGIMSQPDLAAALTDASQVLLEKGPELVIVTLGPNGSFFQTADGSGMVPPFRVETVDAVGCGDAFIAGVLTRLILGLKPGEDWRSRLSPAALHEHLRYANAVGALTALTQGVIPALPHADQVDAFLATHHN
ncbi:MAG: carbohydrate kinase [Chloroflexi bacterium]|nr:carbohydrate kinase [Chloroflexota bacterium]